jgi:hypothetical protein
MLMKRVVGLTYLALLALPISAVADDWQWKITPYLWAAGIDGATSIGPIGADVSIDFADIVDVLSGGALVRVEGQTDRHGVFGDLVYLSLSEKKARDTIGGTLGFKLDNLIVEGAYYYRWNEKYGLELGLRYWDFESTLKPTVLPKVTGSSDWTDGFVGLRIDSAINEKWSWLLRGNVGAGGADLAVGLQLDLRRRNANGNELTFGLRVLDVDYSDQGRRLLALPIDLNMSFAGLTVGYAFGL